LNLIVFQLASLGICILDEDLVDLMLNSLLHSWSTFKQVQKGREHTPSFPEFEGLLLQEELGRKLNRQRDHSKELNYAGLDRGSHRGGHYGCHDQGRGYPSFN